ncbi:hypothetical protein L1049_009019 [Liquidambar formosana]|uniref:Kinesin-like protein n=1 Tax=Liquidambar formosana TaxID=63359 RepID=A0AAP0S3W7_LIQFO
MDNSHSQQQRGGNQIPLSPSQTPRMSKKAARDLQLVDSNSSNGHDRGLNIQVILRCRPLSEDEMSAKTPVVIFCNEHRREVSAIRNISHKQINRTFAFDKVLGPSSKQKDLYDQVVSPIVNEVLEGYTCTIFAYGQTGSGKTYTMEGERKAITMNGEFTDDKGIIPRSVQQIFDTLEAQNAEYSMKVSFLEIYSEEIMDLLAVEECSKFLDEKLKKPITLLEDNKGDVFIRGLEEKMVWTANEIYKILEQGSAKRHTAETLLNKQSSRSHVIFSITIHIKECTSEGKELFKCGKLNLVDLAGSENILRSGAREGRAREAGENNKSLLTLGRVINALVEHSGHVPYRDSKLTRLLRDSLGGKTKTCIIATISPSIHFLEETLSTLNYAQRAKNIKNRPEVNQKMIKSVLIKDLYMEIDRLKQEVYAAREKNGIHIPQDHYVNQESEKKAMAKKIACMGLDSELKEKQLMELQELYIYQQKMTSELGEKLERTQKDFKQNEHALLDLEDRFGQANATIKEKEYLIYNLLKSEKELIERALGLRAELEIAASEVSSLFNTIECKDKIEDRNKVLIQSFQTQLAQQLEVLSKTVAASVTQQEHHLKLIEDNMQSFASTKVEATEELQAQLTKLKDLYGSGFKLLDDLAGELDKISGLAFGNLNSEVSRHSSSLVELFKEVISEANAVLSDLQSNLCNQVEKLSAYGQQQLESHSRSLQTTQSISEVTVNFFKTLSMHATKLSQIVEDAQISNDQKLYELEKKFEEYAATEERQLLEKVAELLASSNARKKRMLQTEVDGLRESDASVTFKLQQELSNVQGLATSVKDKWTTYMEKTETHYLDNTIALKNGKDGLEDDLQNW